MTLSGLLWLTDEKAIALCGSPSGRSTISSVAEGPLRPSGKGFPPSLFRLGLQAARRQQRVSGHHQLAPDWCDGRRRQDQVHRQPVVPVRLSPRQPRAWRF